jgi:hypothetical protein
VGQCPGRTQTHTTHTNKHTNTQTHKHTNTQTHKLVRLGGYIVNLWDFYSYRLIGKLTAFWQFQEFNLPFPLTLCVHKKVVDTLTFRHAGKSQRQISRQSWRRRSGLFKVLVEKEWLVGTADPIFLGPQFESQTDFTNIWLLDLLCSSSQPNHTFVLPAADSARPTFALAAADSARPIDYSLSDSRVVLAE